MEVSQKEKAAHLQRAVINSSVEELSKIYGELGFVEMSAPALGLACRFRGLDVVKCLVNAGASFDFPSTEEAGETYHCYAGTKKGDYRTNYSVYLLKAFGKSPDLPLYCLTGMVMEQQMAREDGSLLTFLPDGERADVLRYLLENREKIAFHPEELLYYAIFYRDTALVNELKRQQVRIPEKRVAVIADGAFSPNGYWDEYVDLMRRLTSEDYLGVMQQLALELDGKLFRYTEGIFDSTKKMFCDERIFEFFLAHFNREKMNKSAVMRGLIDVEAAEAFQVVVREGWLAMPKKRDEMIAYASEEGKTEILAWLLEYKNRTADLAAEQEKADRKLMRELNCAPDSVFALKKMWSWQKQEDGTLLITKYKGKCAEVTVPERIGRSIVTAVGGTSFGRSFLKVLVDQKLKVTLPKSLRYIFGFAFQRLKGLEEIQIPDGVEIIGHYAFDGCFRLRNITIPDSVKEISDHAFNGCSLLEHITIPAQTKTIGSMAFASCSSLESVTISEGVERLDSGAFRDCRSLKCVTIPGTVEQISPAAFCICSQLAKVKLCEGVREIGRAAFECCYLLTDITIPRSVKEIGGYAFDRCCGLKSVHISEGVRQIGAHAFEDCTALTDICLPENVENVGAYVFADCQALVRLDIRGRIRELGKSVFSGCSALTEFMIPETVEKVGDHAFSGCASLKSITIPAAVTEIGKGVFSGCSSLEEVCICGEVKKLGTEAFVDCPKLRAIKIWESIPNRILGETFEQQKGLTVSCPKGSRTEAYCRKKGIPCAELVNDRG
ncbi:MAG: leucine-rich repeat domain-containing protein [Lachnospiraceae bacterium]